MLRRANGEPAYAAVQMLRSLAVTIALLTSPTRAAVLIDRADIGTIIDVSYGGTTLGFTNPALGAGTSFVYVGASDDGRTFNFTYDVANESSMYSRVRSFGFDVTGRIVSVDAEGTYSNIIRNPLSEFFGTDLCFAAPERGTCSSGAGGLGAGQSATGAFALTFADAMASLELDSFRVNYQAVGGLLNGSGRGTAAVTAPALPVPGPDPVPSPAPLPVPSPGPAPSYPSPTPAVPAVPEPASWLMMISGFGLTGWLLRRQRRHGDARNVVPA